MRDKTLIERIARALYERAYFPMPSGWDHEIPARRARWYKQATAALDAHTQWLTENWMVIVPREPTRAMIDAGCRKCGSNLTSASIYKAMIDAEKARIALEKDK